MGGVYCLNALLLAQTRDFVQLDRRQKRAKKRKNACKKIYIFQNGRKNFFFNKKAYKIKAIGFESVPLNIKISAFLVKKEHTFFRISSYTIAKLCKACQNAKNIRAKLKVSMATKATSGAQQHNTFVCFLKLTFALYANIVGNIACAV